MSSISLEDRIRTYLAEPSQKNRLRYYFSNHKMGRHIQENSLFLDSYERFLKNLHPYFMNRYRLSFVWVDAPVERLIVTILALRIPTVRLIGFKKNARLFEQIVYWVREGERFFSRWRKTRFIGEQTHPSRHFDFTAFHQRTHIGHIAYVLFAEIFIANQGDDDRITDHDVLVDLSCLTQTSVFDIILAAALKTSDVCFVDDEMRRGDQVIPGSGKLSRILSPWEITGEKSTAKLQAYIQKQLEKTHFPGHR